MLNNNSKNPIHDYFESSDFLNKEQQFLTLNKLKKVKASEDLIIDTPYSSTNNFCNVELYSHSYVYLHEDAYENLTKLIDLAKQQGYKIKIWDCFRPFNVQAYMADSHPDLVTDGYVSHPVNGAATHVRGIAIDLTLLQRDPENGEYREVNMGSYFDQMDSSSHHGSKLIDDVATKNRNILKNLMEQVGFEYYDEEWWHYNLPIFTRDKDNNKITGFINDPRYPVIKTDFAELCSTTVNNYYLNNQSIKINQDKSEINPENIYANIENKESPKSSENSGDDKKSSNELSKSCCCKLYKLLSSIKNKILSK